MENERLLSPDEVNLLLDFTLTTDIQWNVLLGTGDDVFAEAIQGVIGSRKDIALRREHSGCDTLITCVRELPDLLIIDGSFSDIDTSQTVKCMKNRDTLKDIRIVYASDDATPDSLPFDDVIRKSPFDTAYINRRITSYLYAGYEVATGKKNTGQGRRWPRTVLNLTAGIEILDHTGEVASTGDVVVENISRTGAAVSRINLDGKTHPHENLKFRMKIDHPMLKDWSADAIVVRLKSDDTAGVKFLDISKSDQIKICELFDE